MFFMLIEPVVMSSQSLFENLSMKSIFCIKSTNPTTLMQNVLISTFHLDQKWLCSVMFFKPVLLNSQCAFENFSVKSIFCIKLTNPTTLIQQNIDFCISFESELVGFADFNNGVPSLMQTVK